MENQRKMKKLITSLIGICFALCLMLLPIQATTAKAANVFSVENKTSTAQAPVRAQTVRVDDQAVRFVKQYTTAVEQTRASTAAAKIASNESAFVLALTTKEISVCPDDKPDSARNYGDRHFELPPNLPPPSEHFAVKKRFRSIRNIRV